MKYIFMKGNVNSPFRGVERFSDVHLPTFRSYTTQPIHRNMWGGVTGFGLLQFLFTPIMHSFDHRRTRGKSDPAGIVGLDER